MRFFVPVGVLQQAFGFDSPEVNRSGFQIAGDGSRLPWGNPTPRRLWAQAAIASNLAEGWYTRNWQIQL